MTEERVMMFIDGSNIFHVSNDFEEGFRVDYLKLRDILVEDRNLIRPYFFASIGVPPSSGQMNFFNRLSHEGFQVVKKPLKQRGNEMVEKGVDVALATKMLSLAFLDAYDVGIVVTGDKDYLDVINEVKEMGKKIEIASFNIGIGMELKLAADKFIPLDDIANEIRLE